MEDPAGAWSEFCQQLLQCRALMHDLYSDGGRRSSGGEPSARSVARLARWGADGCVLSLPNFVAAEKRRPAADRTLLNPVLELRNGAREAFPPYIATALVRAITQYVDDFRPDGLRSLQNAEGVRPATNALGAAYRLVLDGLPDYYPEGLRLGEVAELTRLDRWQETDQESASLPGRYSGRIWRGGKTWSDTLAEHEGDLVVLGDPGFGKSTILKVHALALTAAGRTPAYAHLTHFAARLAQRLRPIKSEVMDALVAAVLDGLVMELDAESCRVLRADVASGRSEVLLDGWDEVTDQAARKAIERALRTLELPGRLIVASRITGYTLPVADATELVISALDRERIRAFIDLWHRYSKPELSPKDRLVAAMEASTDFESLMEVPVLAGFAALIATHNADVPTRRAPLYARATELLLTQVWKKDSPSYNPPSYAERVERIESASQLAWSMATAGAPADQPEEWGDEVTWRHARSLVPTRLRDNVNPLFGQDGLLIRAAPSIGSDTAVAGLSADDVFVWLHRTIQEYLCAEHLCAQTLMDTATGMREAAQRALADPWSVVLDLYAGILYDRHPVLDEAWRTQLWKLHQAADPGDRYGLMLLGVMEELPGRTPADPDVVDFAFATDHGIRFRLGLDRAARNLLDIPLPGGWVSDSEARNLLAMDEKKVRELLEQFIETDGGWGGRLANAAELARLDRVAAQQVVVDHLVREQPYFPAAVLRDLPNDLTAKLLTAYETTPWPRKLRLAEALASTGRTEVVEVLAANHATDVQGYLLAQAARQYWPDDRPQEFVPSVEPAQLLAAAAVHDVWTQVWFAQYEPKTVLAGWEDATDWMRLALVMYSDQRDAVLDRTARQDAELTLPDPSAALSTHVRFGLALLRLEAAPDRTSVPAILQMMRGVDPPPFRWADYHNGPLLDWESHFAQVLRRQDPRTVYAAALACPNPAVRSVALSCIEWRALQSGAVDLTRNLSAVPTSDLSTVGFAIGSPADVGDATKAVTNTLEEATRSSDSERRKELLALADWIAGRHRPRLWATLISAWTTLLSSSCQARDSINSPCRHFRSPGGWAGRDPVCAPLPRRAWRVGLLAPALQ